MVGQRHAGTLARPVARDATAWVAGLMLCTAGVAKLTPRGRRSASQTALAILLPSVMRGHVRGTWAALALSELVAGAGLLAGFRTARAASSIMSLGGVGYTLLASRRAPDRPCGCLGAHSEEPARAGLPRSCLLTSLCLTSVLADRRPASNLLTTQP